MLPYSKKMHQINFKNAKYPTILPLKIKDMNDYHDKENSYVKKKNNFARCQWSVAHSNVQFYAYIFEKKSKQNVLLAKKNNDHEVL